MKKIYICDIMKKSFMNIGYRKGRGMDFKIFYDKAVNLIYDNRQKIVKVCLTALSVLLLMIVLYFSSDNLNVNKEVEDLVTYIENRNYGEAEDYYDDLLKKFSDSKMDRFNKKASKKLSSLLMNSADAYINNKITKEHYMGLINMINSLNTIKIDSTSLIDLAKRVDEMYKEENLSYEKAYSYFQITSTLRGVKQNLDEYKQHIKTLYESREIYKEATKYQSIKKYNEAIKYYDKVIEEDEKYYSLAQNAKKECINTMYDYYMDNAKNLANGGKYEEAVKYLGYLTPYYDEEEIDELIEEYNGYISNYTMSTDDIISLISRRGNLNKNDLEIVSYLQTINSRRYYYAEVIKDNKVINEVLIDTKNKNMYSYKSDKKDYDCTYSDGYFKIDENSGQIILSIDKNEGRNILEEELNSDEKKYKNIKELNNNEIKKYNNNELNKMIKNNGNIYYYYLINTGWFKPKEVYIVNIYNKEIYTLTENGVEPY